MFVENKNKVLLLLLVVLVGIGLGYDSIVGLRKDEKREKDSAVKLYWFIPDGMRAEPELFDIYEWAEEGKLPNIKKMMEKGSYGFSQPTFPSHTPTNFASLLTGTYPDVHGVNDGPMRVVGKPLDKVAVGGFRSVAKKVDPIWTTLEDKGYKSSLISIPGSTPPEIEEGVVLRGRWGGWGADFHALNFESKGDMSQRIEQGRGSRLFFFGPKLTQYIEGVEPEGWEISVESYSDPMEVELNGWGSVVYGYVYDSTDDNKINYDQVLFSKDKSELLAKLSEGEWSEWFPIDLSWNSGEEKVKVVSNAKATVIKLDEDGFFRLRLFYDNLNRYNAMPASASDVMHEKVGPMADFVDNFPPQLIYYKEDKSTFLDEAWMTFDWHEKAVSQMVESYSPDVVIHDIYTPNQMLTSRWWMGYIDPESARYNEKTDKEREKLWGEVEEMYKRLDRIVGEVLENTSEEAYVVLSSDHGAVPLNRWVNLNNLFAKKGWLEFEIDPDTGEPVIDWENSQVIYLKFAHVYINPNGLGGDYERAEGEEYEKLRQEVKEALLSLEDDRGNKPVVEAIEWEKAKEYMKLDPERIGDLVITNEAGYGWNEEMSKDLALFSEPLKTGYKQAIRPDTPGMWTPFMIMGPRIKEGNYLGDKPIEHVDQYPTIMKALGEEIPEFVQGTSVDVFESRE